MGNEIKQVKVKKEKKPKYKGHTACTLTLVLAIICAVTLGIIALAPVLTGLFGVLMGLIAGLGVIIVTVFTLGMGWISEGFRNFWSNTFGWIGKVFDGSDVIKSAVGPHYVLIAIFLFLGAVSGFVTNLVFFIKHKQNKAKFIISCVFLALALLNLILGFVVYLN